MNRKKVDWKDVSNGYFDKSLALAILVLLFAFIVSPHFEVKPLYHEIIEMESVYIPPDIFKKIELPNLLRPEIIISVDDEFVTDDEDIPVVDTITKTTLDSDNFLTSRLINPQKKNRVWEDPPVVIKKVSPKYPVILKKLNIQGQIKLDVEVLKDGTVGRIEVVESVLQGSGGLDQAAIEAVRKWIFQPAKVNGKPIDCWVTFPINFRLE